jgi:hypothetical protein
VPVPRTADDQPKRLAMVVVETGVDPVTFAPLFSCR